ncbi:MAG: hypothetical protein FWD61_06470 [Phycisphaerales bacterium]|nr:hypothetical protein [Phycisphaerales bacterium]
MPTFTCRHCGITNTINEADRDKPLRCLNCKTIQNTSADATPTPNPSTLQQPPQHILLQIMGTLIIIAGIIQIIVPILIVTKTEDGPLLLGTIGGLITMGFGFVIFCLRRIAIDVWHIRRRQ